MDRRRSHYDSRVDPCLVAGQKGFRFKTKGCGIIAHVQVMRRERTVGQIQMGNTMNSNLISLFVICCS